VIVAAASLFFAAACAPTLDDEHDRRHPVPTKDPVYEQDIRDWHARRVERLKAPGGWLSLVGLYWLKEGGNRVGSDERLEIVLPKSARPKWERCS